MKRMKKILTALLICSMCFGSSLPAMAEEDGAGTDNSLEQGNGSDDSLNGGQIDGDTGSDDSDTEDDYSISVMENDLLGESGDGTLKTDMPENEQIYITLADNTDYRWNANGNGGENSVIHLDDYTGSNCNFQLYRVSEDGNPTDYYGIRYEGTQRFADIEKKSKDEEKKLHLYETDEKELEDNPHRQFAFYHVKTDDYGNDYYYIQNRNSGLWMGYEDAKNDGPSMGDKIWQTSKENRKLWIITKCVVPKQGGEVEDLIAYKEGSTTQREDGVFVSFFKKDTIECVTSNLDLAAKYTNLHFYRMGTNSKMLLKWDAKHSAYEIHYYTDGENYREAVWDIEDEGAKENADVHLWSWESKKKNENTSQLWRFFKQSDESYKIQNAKTGKFIAYQYDDEGEEEEGKEEEEDSVSSGTLKQLDDSEGTFDGQVRKLAYFTIDRFAGTDNPVNFNYSVDWMNDIPDDALLSSVNIPGTHDTGTASVLEDFSAQVSITSCQKYYYGEQLNVGARSFDVRCNATKDDATPGDVKIVHGSSIWQCYERGSGDDLTLESILNDSVRFLANHRSEAIVMMIKPDAGSEIGLTCAIANFIKSNEDYVWTGGGIPTMGEARGKIVFIRRYDISDYNYIKDGLEAKYFGIDLTSWDNHSYSDYEYAISIHNFEDKEFVYAQDAYNVDSDDKKGYIEGTLKQTVGEDPAHEIPYNSWVYNYTSCAGGDFLPLDLTRDINPWLYNGDASKYFDNRRLGMVMLNFIDSQMSKLVYETNFQNGGFFELKAIPPEVTVTYGNTLGEAVLSGGTEKGTWSFDDPDVKPTYNDYKNGTEYSMTFTPYDTDHYCTISTKVKITNFIKKPIVVTVDDKEMTYGDAEIPEFTYSFDESQLEEGDKVDDLGITMKISPLYSTTGRLRAGSYAITATSDSDSYDVQFAKAEGTDQNVGRLTVRRKTLGIQWSDTKNLVYAGAPVNVTAEITGVLEDDKCHVVVTGGRETGPSWSGDSSIPPTPYTATAQVLGEDFLNYMLPEHDDGHEYQTSINYYIRRAEADDYIFPTKATMTYGQTLSEATLIGASGAGEFVFVEKDTEGHIEKLSNTVPAAGEQEYYIAYIPKDKEFEHAVVSKDKIPVNVSKKPVTVTADAKEKTYGDTTPVLTYAIEGDPLVGEDTEEDLKLTLTAGAGDDQFCDVGKYKIVMKECKNPNYDVTVISANLTVSKREVEIEWNGLPQYTYSGGPVNITAQVKLPETWPEDRADDYNCEVVVIGGKQTDAGSYTARAIALKNKNYAFKEDAKKTFEYEIVKATPKVTFPASATITYGQTLDQAEFTGGVSSVDGKFVFEDSEEFLTVSESGKKYSVTFVPDDTKNYNTVDGKDKVPVTVNPKSLTVGAYNQKKIYGQETPELTWYLDKSQLVGNDSAEEFDIELTAGEGDDKYCDVGGYSIKIATDGIKEQNPNYKINFINGTLKVDPLMAEIQWSDTTNIKIGDPGPSARITNLVKEDEDCSVVVEYDDGTGVKGTDKASWDPDTKEITVFNARITGLEGSDRYNYTLPDDDDLMHIQYYVRRNDPEDYHMPVGAIMTYGQKLSEARMILASGDGEFTFVEGQNSLREIGDTVPDAGTYKYTVMFTPNNLDAERRVWQEIEVKVKPKAITANALSGEKTYGEETVLDFEMDESQLVSGDTKEDLGLKLTATNSSYDGDKVNSPVGLYKISKKECKNPNYDVTVVTAEFYIHQKEVSLTWSDVSNLVYTGKPVSVTATAEGILEGDQCEVNVVNGNKIQPGTYRALAVSLTNSNYTLPKEYDQLIKEYTIQEAKDNGGGSGGDNGGGSGTNNGDSSGKNKGEAQNTSDPTSIMFVLLMLLLVVLSGTTCAMIMYRKRRMK